MKLDEDEAIVDVQICTERDDVLLTAAGGHCIRFPVPDVRVFAGPQLDRRARLHFPGGRKVISLTILRHVNAEPGRGPPICKPANAAAAEAATRRNMRMPTAEEAPRGIELSEGAL